MPLFLRASRVVLAELRFLQRPVVITPFLLILKQAWLLFTNLVYHAAHTLREEDGQQQFPERAIFPYIGNMALSDTHAFFSA